MRQRHRLGRLLRAAGEQHHRRLSGVGRRHRAADAARQPAHRAAASAAARACRSSLAQVFEVTGTSAPSTCDAGAVDERLRRDDVRQPHQLRAAWARLAGPGRPVEHDRQLAGQVQAQERDVAGDRRRQQQADVRRRAAAQAARQDQRADQQPLVGQHAGQVVGDQRRPCGGPGRARRTPRGRSRRGSPAARPWGGRRPRGGRRLGGGLLRPGPRPGPELAERLAAPRRR